MKKVIIYGVGKNCDTFIRYACEKDFEIVAFADMNRADQSYYGQIIITPEQIKFIEYDEVFLMINLERDRLKDWLVDQFGINREQIRDVEYLNQRYMLAGISKYRFVFFTDEPEYLNLPYQQVKNQKNVTIRGILWIGKDWDVDKAVIENQSFFIFRSHCFRKYEREHFYEYIRRHFPNGKMIFLLSDLCEGEFGYLNRIETFSIEYIRKRFDLIITYHSLEAKKYGFQYYEFVYTKTPLRECEKSTDLFFVGAAKNRLEDIHRLYRAARDYGLLCSFWITRVEPEQMLVKHEGIIYNTVLSYQEYLNQMMRCKCIVDICQKYDQTTTRYSEAVVYNKKLLVNDMNCNQKSCYNDIYIQRFEHVEEIDFEWVRNEDNVNYHYQDEFSPLHFLEYLEHWFEKGKQT